MRHNDREKQPLIGISATLLTIESGSFIGRERAAVGADYVWAIQQAGGVPVVLPVIEDPKKIECQLECIDGLLLSGGYDVTPLQYGEEAQRGLETLCIERDTYEIQLAKIAYQSQKPILGICRGLQLMNVAFGGTLYQDISLNIPGTLQHHIKAKPEAGTHTVELVKETRLQQLMGDSTLLVNSFHHQAIKNLAPGFIINAFAKDGVIEGIEKTGNLFILGVQWHPEFMIIKHPMMQKLFLAFIEAIQKKKMPL